MSIINTVTPYSNNETPKTAIATEYVRAKTPLGSTPSSISTVSVLEYSTGADVVTELTLTNFLIGTVATSNLGIGAIVYTFPAGQHLELVYSLSNLSITSPSTQTVSTGLGSVVASGAVTVISGTATFMDRLTAVAVSSTTSGGTAVNSLVAATAGIGTGISLNVAASVKNVFLNAASGWGTAGNVTASGKILLKWVKMN